MTGDPEPAFQADLRLMSRAATGDRSAQREVVLRLRARAHRLAQTLVPNTSDANDVLQDSLVEVLRSARGYRGEAPLEGWADRIVLRQAMRWVRRSRARQSQVEAGADPDDVISPTSAAGRLAEGAARPLRHYLDGLSEPLRTALLLRHALGYSVPEVAEATGVSVRRVKRRLLRALERVRAQMDADAAAPAERGRA